MTPDDTRLELPGDLSCSRCVLSPYGSGETEFGAVRTRDYLIDIRVGQDRQDRAELLLADQPRIIGDVAHNCRCDEIARSVEWRTVGDRLPEERIAALSGITGARAGQLCGISATPGYSYFFRKVLSLAFIDTPLAVPGTQLTVLWGAPGNPQTEIRAMVAPAPYKKDNRRVVLNGQT